MIIWRRGLILRRVLIVDPQKERGAKSSDWENKSWRGGNRSRGKLGWVKQAKIMSLFSEGFSEVRQMISG